jgi:hypothetical protein
MTGYTIEVGYNSSHHKEDVGIELVKVSKEIKNNPNLIYDEVLRIEKRPEDGTLDDLKCHTNHYKNCDDLTIRIFDDYEKAKKYQSNVLEEDFYPFVCQTASSGNGFRGIKEQCRRAFCRLVLERMHSKGMEVNIIVS